MTDPRQSGAGPGARSELDAHSGASASGGSSARGQLIDCATVESWLAELAESALPEAVAEQVRLHAANCPACTEKLAQVRRGREWLLVLKQESLQPPADLVAKILARTSLAKAGAGSADIDHPVLDFPKQSPSQNRPKKNIGFKEAAGNRAIQPGTIDSEDHYLPQENISIPAWQHSSVVVLRRTLLDPRLALVAAMAFFSISLTLNMLGFRLTGMHAADFKPGNMHRAVIRQVANTNASVVRYYENLRIVYEVEARVQQLRRAAETTPPPQQRGTRPRKQSFDSNGDSSGNSSNPPSNSQDSQESHGQRLAAGPDSRHAQPSDPPDPKPVTTGPRMDAAFHLPSLQAYPAAGWVESAIQHTLATSFVAPFSSAPQAAPCSLRNICSSMRYFSTPERRLA